MACRYRTMRRRGRRWRCKNKMIWQRLCMRTPLFIRDVARCLIWLLPSHEDSFTSNKMQIMILQQARFRFQLFRCLTMTNHGCWEVGFGFSMHPSLLALWMRGRFILREFGANCKKIAGFCGVRKKMRTAPFTLPIANVPTITIHKHQR